MGSTIQEYLASLRSKRVVVLGVGASNTPLIEMLLRVDVEVTACDKRRREGFGGQVEEPESPGAGLRLGPDYLGGSDHDMIFRTPGLRPDVPQLLTARERGSTITSEMEAFFQVCPCKAIVVTGSDGKTTTATITAELLKAAGQSVYVESSIGKPLLPDMDGVMPKDVAILELSSFQLATMEQSPDIAMITNLAPNHLGVHKSMREYVAAKENILTRQGTDGLLALDQSNEIIRGFAVSAHGRVTRFNHREELEQGVFVKDKTIWVRNAMHERPMLYLGNILLPGEHNIESYMAVIGALDRLVPDQVVWDSAIKFTGVEHRIELMRTRNGMRYYNGSIASGPSRIITDLRSFRQKVALIADGYNRHIPFDVLGPEVMERVKALVLIDDTAPKLRQAVERAPGYDPAALPTVECKDFEAAMLAACGLTQPGDMVFLSPACTSFDRFKSSMEWGAVFERIIYGLE